MNYLTVLPYDLRQHFYQQYLLAPKEWAVFWLQLPALANCDKFSYSEGMQCAYKKNLLHHFISCNYLPLVRWAFRQNWRFPPDAIDTAVTNGHIEIVKWLYSSNIVDNMNSRPLYSAVSHDHLDILQYLVAERKYQVHTIIYRAIDASAINILQWLCDNYKGKDVGMNADIISCHAVKYINVAVIQWLIEKQLCSLASIVDLVVCYGQFNILDWLIKLYPQMRAEIILAARQSDESKSQPWLATINVAAVL